MLSRRPGSSSLSTQAVGEVQIISLITQKLSRVTLRKECELVTRERKAWIDVVHNKWNTRKTRNKGNEEEREKERHGEYGSGGRTFSLSVGTGPCHPSRMHSPMSHTNKYALNTHYIAIKIIHGAATYRYLNFEQNASYMIERKDIVG